MAACGNIAGGMKMEECRRWFLQVSGISGPGSGVGYLVVGVEVGNGRWRGGDVSGSYE